MAETLIPLEEREEERRPSRVEPPRRSGGWVGKLALVLAVVALAGACRRGRMTHRSQGREQSPLPSPTGTGSSPSWKGWR